MMPVAGASATVRWRARPHTRRFQRSLNSSRPQNSSSSAAAQGSPARSVSQARVGGDQTLVRSVEMSLGARNQVTKLRGGRYLIESADPSIPLDRVPYFTKDLVRLAVVGAAMVVLLGVGSIAVPLIVK